MAQWEAIVTDGCEADDMLGVRQIELDGQSIICTIDKDLKQIPGYHYNFVKKEKFTVSDEEATRFFYYQMLVGDTTDNIKGVVGIGPKKAERILSGCVTEEEMFDAVRDTYSNDEEMLMNAGALYIWQCPYDAVIDRFKRLGGCMFGENETTEREE